MHLPATALGESSSNAADAAANNTTRQQQQQQHQVKAASSVWNGVASGGKAEGSGGECSAMGT